MPAPAPVAMAEESEHRPRKKLAVRSARAVYRELLVNSPQQSPRMQCQPDCCISLLNPPTPHRGTNHQVLPMTSTRPPAVYSMHWDNIPENILQQQRAVFDHLQIELIQENANKVSHGTWMNGVIQRKAPDDIIIFCDIDAFPIQRSAYLQAIDHAQRGAVFGLAQFSNHKKGTELYAGPMFMAFQKSTWEAMGSPALKPSSDYDAAEVMSALARKNHIELVLSRPSSCLIPKWALGHEGLFGIGTFYGHCDFFHLFESRKPAYDMIFHAVAQDVLGDRPLNFRHYLEIVETLQHPQETGQRRSKTPGFWQKLFK